MTTPPARDRVLLIAALMVTQTIGWGTTFSQIGILAEPMSSDLGISRRMIFAGATVMYLGAALAAPPAGRLADRIGGLRLLVPGSVVLAVALMLLSATEGAASYLSVWLLVGLVLHVGLVTAAYTGLTQTLGADAARGIGTLALATGLSSTLFWPLSELALGYMDWRNLLRVYGLVMLCICAPLHMLLVVRFGGRRRRDQVPRPDPAPPHILPGRERAGFNLQVFTACAALFATVSFGIAVIEIYVELGTSREVAVSAGSLIGVAFVVGRGLMTLFADRIAPPRVAQITYLSLAASFVPLLVCALAGIPLPGWLAVAVAIAFGLPAGLVGILRSVFPLYLFGSLGFGSLLGRQSRLTELASAVSPAALSALMALSVPGAVGFLAASSAVAWLGTLGLGRMIRAPVPENA